MTKRCWLIERVVARATCDFCRTERDASVPMIAFCGRYVDLSLLYFDISKLSTVLL